MKGAQTPEIMSGVHLMVLQWVALGVTSHPLQIGRVSKAIVDYFSWGEEAEPEEPAGSRVSLSDPGAAQAPCSSAKAARTASTSGMTSSSGSCRILT